MMIHDSIPIVILLTFAADAERVTRVRPPFSARLTIGRAEWFQQLYYSIAASRP